MFTEVNFVRAVIVVYAVLALSSSIMLFRNAAAPDALKNTSIALVSIITVALAVAPYLVLNKTTRNFSLVLLYDSRTNALTTGTEWNPYASAYLSCFANLKNYKDALSANSWGDFIGDKGLDIIEKGIISRYMMLFQFAWDSPLDTYFTPIGTLSSSVSTSQSPGDFISLAQIMDKFQHNKLINEEVLPQLTAIIPPGTKVNTKQEKNKRTILFSNDYGETKIEIVAMGGGVAQQGVWGVLKEDPSSMDRYASLLFQVKLIFTPNIWTQYSPSTTSQKKWFEKISQFLSVMDWNNVDTEINTNLDRELKSKLLLGR